MHHTTSSLDCDKVVWFENLDGLGNFGPEQVITTLTDGARDVVAADLDGDGDQDVVSVSTVDDKLAWYENVDGSGSFGVQQVLSTDVNALIGSVTLQCDDIDNDGDQDVLWSSTVLSSFGMFSEYDTRIAWHENRGVLGFVQHDIIVVIDGVSAQADLHLTDLDGDGDLDLCALTNDGGQGSDPARLTCFTFLEGSGDFGAGLLPVSLTKSDRLNSISSMDVDGDDDLDLVVAFSFVDQTAVGFSIVDQVVWFANLDGTGSLGARQVLIENFDDIDFVLASDLDGNGDPDLITGALRNDLIAWNRKTPGSATVGERITITTGVPRLTTARVVRSADFDGDGDLDLLAGSTNVSWFENLDGQGSFGAERIISRAVQIAVSVDSGDMDGDGDQDALSASNSDNKIAWYENPTGKGRFGPQRLIANSMMTATFVFSADLDEDGDLDVLSASAGDDKIAWYENIAGTGEFSAQIVISTSVDNAQCVQAADIDGDGDLDVLAAAANSGRLSWFENLDSSLAFGPLQQITNKAPKVQFVRAADLDGDGDQDIVSAIATGNEVAWFENTNGLGVFGPKQVILSTVQSAPSVDAVDIDGDGDLDVLSVSSNNDKLGWLENLDGLGNFGPEQLLDTDAMNGESIHAADLDGDGDPDVVAVAGGLGRIAWYKNSLTSNVQSAEVVRLGTPPNPAALLPGVTSAPIIGASWDPVIDHATFVPGAIFDVFSISLTPANTPMPPIGTLLCGPNIYMRIRLPGSPLNLDIPNSFALVGVRLCAGGGSFDSSSNLVLTNALDITIGNF